MEVDGDLIVKAAGVILTAIGGIYQWRNLRFRSKLKSDLEILKLYEAYGADSPQYQALRNSIDATIEKTYSPREQGILGKEKLPDLLLGIFFLIGSILWVTYGVQTGIPWWRVLVAVAFAFIGVGGLLNAFSTRGSK